MAITPTTEKAHLAEARALLLGQFKDKVKLTAFLDALTRQFSDAEVAALEVLTVRNGDIDNLLTDGLDIWGKILGIPRLGRTDAEYKVALKVRIKVAESSGLADELITIALLSSPNAEIYINENFPASFNLQVLGFEGDAVDAAELAAFLAQARAAAVAGSLIYSPTPSTGLFIWETGTTPQSTTTQGWSNITQTNGGELTYLLSL